MFYYIQQNQNIGKFIFTLINCYSHLSLSIFYTVFHINRLVSSYGIVCIEILKNVLIVMVHSSFEVKLCNLSTPLVKCK